MSLDKTPASLWPSHELTSSDVHLLIQKRIEAFLLMTTLFAKNFNSDIFLLDAEWEWASLFMSKFANFDIFLLDAEKEKTRCGTRSGSFYSGGTYDIRLWSGR